MLELHFEVMDSFLVGEKEGGGGFKLCTHLLRRFVLQEMVKKFSISMLTKNGNRKDGTIVRVQWYMIVQLIELGVLFGCRCY